MIKSSAPCAVRACIKQDVLEVSVMVRYNENQRKAEEGGRGGWGG